MAGPQQIEVSRLNVRRDIQNAPVLKLIQAIVGIWKGVGGGVVYRRGLCWLLGPLELGGGRLGVRGSKGPASVALEHIMNPI